MLVIEAKIILGISRRIFIEHQLQVYPEPCRRAHLYNNQTMNNNNTQHNHPSFGSGSNSRASILEAIANNKPALVPLPIVDMNAVIQYEDVLTQFKKVLESIGGIVVKLNNIEELKIELEQEKANGNFIVNTIQALGDVVTNLESLTAIELEAVHKSYLQGSIAVAENGCVWLYEHQMVNRLLPFICQHLVLVVEQKNIVPTMHHAYQTIDTAKEGFGIFIAGPSKTADIEQSLVIGAHGARSLVVYLV